MTERVRQGLGLPAGIYRLSKEEVAPTFFAPNGITADGVASIVCANVVPVSGSYDIVLYDGSSGVFVPGGSTEPSPSSFNHDAWAFADDILHSIFSNAQPEGEFPYSLEESSSRANIVGDLATLKADFILTPPT